MEVDVAIDFKARQLSISSYWKFCQRYFLHPKNISVLAYESSILVRFKLYDKLVYLSTLC